jgi:hypothetical protein
MAVLGTSWICPFEIHAPSTSTSFEEGGFSWKFVQASGVPGGMVGQVVPALGPAAMVTGEKPAFPEALELRIAHNGLFAGFVSPGASIPGVAENTPRAALGSVKSKPVPPPPAAPCKVPSWTWSTTCNFLKSVKKKLGCPGM